MTPGVLYLYLVETNQRVKKFSASRVLHANTRLGALRADIREEHLREVPEGWVFGSPSTLSSIYDIEIILWTTYS